MISFFYACRFPTQIVFETEEQAAITIAAMRQVIPVFWTLWENLGGSKIFDVTPFSLFRSDFFLTRVKSEDQPSSRWTHLANYQSLFDEHLTLHVCWKLVLEIAKVMELGKVSRKKKLFFWILSKWGGEGPVQIVWPLFISAFLVNNRSLYFQS